MPQVRRNTLQLKTELFKLIRKMSGRGLDESVYTAQEEKLLILKGCLIQLGSQTNNQCLEAQPSKLK